MQAGKRTQQEVQQMGGTTASYPRNVYDSLRYTFLHDHKNLLVFKHKTTLAVNYTLMAKQMNSKVFIHSAHIIRNKLF